MTNLQMTLRDGTKLEGQYYSETEALSRVFMALASGELESWTKREIR